MLDKSKLVNAIAEYKVVLELCLTPATVRFFLFNPKVEGFQHLFHLVLVICNLKNKLPV